MTKISAVVLEVCLFVNVVLTFADIAIGKYEAAIFSAFMGLFCYWASNFIRSSKP